MKYYLLTYAIRPISVLLIAALISFGQSNDLQRVSLDKVNDYLRGIGSPNKVDLKVSCTPSQDLVGITICDVTESTTVETSGNTFRINDINHPASWSIAFNGEGRSFVLNGFATGNEFNDLISTRNLKISSDQQAVEQVKLFLRLVQAGDAPIIVSSNAELLEVIKEYQKNYSIVEIDPNLQQYIQKPSLHPKLTPPNVNNQQDSYIVSFFGLQQANKQLKLKRFSFRVLMFGTIDILAKTVNCKL